MREIDTPQLQNEEFGFCKVKKDDKKPFEPNWQKQGYKFNDLTMLNHISLGGNAGIIAGFGNLRILDIDNKQYIPHFDKVLEDTLAVETANSNRHYYIISEYDNNHVLTNGAGEFRAKNMMVLVPGCTIENNKEYKIINDKPIKVLSKEEVEELLKDFIGTGEAVTQETKEDKPKDTTKSGKEFAELCRLVKKGKTKEQIFEEMACFRKWVESPQAYKDHSYKSAVEKVAADKDEKEKAVKEAKGMLEKSIEELFTDQDGTPHATIKIKEHLENLPVSSRNFKNFITKIVYERTGRPPSNNTITSLQNIFSAKAMFEGKKYDVFVRMAYVNDTVYADIGDTEWNILKITSNEIKVIQEQEVKFKRFRHMKPLAIDFDAESEDINLILKHIPLQDEEDKILFKTYLVLLFLEGVPTVILVIYGPQGSGKTIVLKLTRSLADPSSLSMLSLPKDIKELVQQVGHHYLAYYDNVSYISKAFSDFFCRVVTGEGYSKRELYSDDEDIIYNYRRKIAINGINLPGQEADLLDRCLTIHLARINKKFRKTEEDLWASFETDRPKITGAIIKIVQKTLQKVKGVKLDYLPRMADYAKWGEAISQVLGEEPGKFMQVYFNKIDKLNKEALEANPVGLCIAELMDNYDFWAGTPTELLNLLVPIAEDLRVDKNPQWPKGSQVLTRKINEITSNLEDEGIKFEFGHTGKKRFIKLTKETVNTVNAVNSEEKKDISDTTTNNNTNNTITEDPKEVLNDGISDITAITDDNTNLNSVSNHQNTPKTSVDEVIPDEKEENNTINTKNTEVENKNGNN